MRQKLAVFAAADLANGPCRTGRRAAGAIIRLGVAAIALADARVRVVAVGGPCTPVVSEDVSCLEGRLRSRPRRAESAGRAGLVIDRLFRAGRTGFQILRFRNFRRKIVRQEFAVFAAADRADGPCRTGRRAAGAVVRLGVAAIALADAGVCVVSIGGPCTPVVSEDVSCLEGRLRSRANRAETAGRAGLVIDRLFRAGRTGFQILRFRNFRRKIVRQEFAVFAAADRADGPCRTGRRAAGAVVRLGVAAIALADAGVCVVSIGGPCTPVVSEDVSCLEGRLRSRANRAETAGRAGLVIDRLFRAGRTGFQILRFRNFRRKIVRQKLAVFAAADRADGPCRTGCRAAGAAVRLGVAAVALADARVCTVAVGGPCTPVVVQRGIRCGKRIGVVGAYFSARTG